MFSPSNETEMAEILVQSDTPIFIKGGSSQGIRLQGTPLSTASLSGIVEYEPAALCLISKAGSRIADIQETLQKEGQRLAFEPPNYSGVLQSVDAPSIGGAIAANLSGPRRVQVGAARDFALGVRFIDGMGRLMRNGGRVMKNVTGYDLVKLMCGSFGTLGVLTEIALKVQPIPQSEMTLQLHGLNDAQAINAMSAAMGSPYQISAAAHVNEAQGTKTLFRIEGFESSVTYRHQKLCDLLSAYCPEISTAGDSDNLWKSIRDLHAFHGLSGDLWRVHVKPSDAPAVIKASGAKKYQMDWAGGLLWFLCPQGHDLRACLGDISGHATLLRGNAHARFHPEPLGIARLSQKLRMRFDPKSILNQGLMDSR